jgi:hypothetical protein
MRPQETHTDWLPLGSLTYEPDPESFWGGTITIDLPVDPPAPRQHLLKAASERLSIEASDDWPDEWFDERPENIEHCLDKVATHHLRNATRSNAYIRQGAERLTAPVFLPTPLLERPYAQLSASVYESKPVFDGYGQAAKYLDYTKPRELTSYQEGILPKVIESVRDIVPSALQPHVDDIAYLVAQEIPSQADLLHAYQRTSVPEVLAEYHRESQPQQLPPEYQQAVKTAQLDFPRHATEAVRTASPAVASSPARTHAGISAGHAFDR